MEIGKAAAHMTKLHAAHDAVNAVLASTDQRNETHNIINKGISPCSSFAQRQYNPREMRTTAFARAGKQKHSGGVQGRFPLRLKL
jgi:hypothetical protein